MVVLAYFNIAQHVSIWCDTFLRVFNKVQHVDMFKKMAASTFGRSQIGRPWTNIGFAFETSGFQVDPLFLKVMIGEGIYRHTYIKRSLAFSLNKNCVNDIYTYIT